MKVLLIDDVRTASFIKSTYNIDVTTVAKSFAEGISELKANGPWDLLLLDHDLSSYNEEGDELTGTHIMAFLEDNPELLPKDLKLVTANPVGGRRMQDIWNRIKGK
jgi:hypothetical protein